MHTQILASETSSLRAQLSSTQEQLEEQRKDKQQLEKQFAVLQADLKVETQRISLHYYVPERALVMLMKRLYAFLEI